MTNVTFLELQSKARRGDYLCVRINPEHANWDDLPSVLTEFGSGECCHVEMITQPEIGAVISANGKEVAVENWDKYIPHLGALTLYLLRIPNETPEQTEARVKYQESRLGIKYNWNIIRHMGEKDFVCKIPLLGMWINKWIWSVGKDPKKPEGVDGTICSKEATLTARKTLPNLLSEYNIDDIDPTDFFHCGLLDIIYRAA